MHVIMARTAVPMLLILAFGALSFAGESPTPPASSAPSIARTYRLVSRQFPDGTMLKPPEVMGLWTYTKTHRHLNTIRKDATGTFASFSIVSTYRFCQISRQQGRNRVFLHSQPPRFIHPRDGTFPATPDAKRGYQG